jgi:hypothetical protein
MTATLSHPRGRSSPQEPDPAKGEVLKQLDLVGGHPHRNDVNCWDQKFVPVKEPFLDQPLIFLENVALCPIGHPHRQR